MAKRITARVPDDVGEKLAIWSERFGVTQSQLAGMAIQAGMGSILRAVAPEEAISPDVLAQVIASMKKQDLDIEGLKDENSSVAGRAANTERGTA